MVRWFDWCSVFIFTALVVVLCSFHAIERWPSEDYVDAMSRGQYERARMHLSAQVQEGNPKAQTALANLHYLGLGGPADLDEAASLYHMAASKGFGAAQLNMGHLYKQGLGVAKDVERAFGWYMHANISNSVWAEYYMNQISVELTLSPLQMSVVKDRWSKLIDLASEPL